VDTHASKEAMTITYKASGRLLNENDLHSIPLLSQISRMIFALQLRLLRIKP